MVKIFLAKFARTNAFWFLLVLFFSLPALSSLLTAAPTRSADGLLHLYRLVQLDALWQQGILFSRWLPDVAYGYGLPLLNYYAPLAYYLAAPLHTLGIPFTLTLNLALAAALLCGASGMFFFTCALVRNLSEQANDKNGHTENFAALAGITAALAFLYAPYVLFNALQRANLAEQWALAFAPFALWRVLELIRKPNAGNWALAVLFFAAVLLSHNVTGLLLAPILFGFAFVVWFAERATRKTGLLLTSALLCALGLSAFFWLPALVEREFVQIARVIVTPDFDYRFNFVSFGELFALLPRADTGRLNPIYPNTLGLAQIILAVTGLVVVSTRFRTRRALPFYFLALAALGFVCLMLAFSQPVWDNISLLSFVQLPMRMRGLIALCLAPLSGIFIFAFAPRWRAAVTSAALIVFVLSALPLLYPRYARHVPLNPTMTDMFTYEKQSGAFGTTSFGEYLPLWVQNLPDSSPFLDIYTKQNIPNRFVLPEGVNVCGNKVQSLEQTLCVEAKDSWYGTFRAFYFPGWQVTLDGRNLEIVPTPRTGLISFRAPGGGTLRAAYVGTDTEHIADWLSLASALLVLSVIAFGRIKVVRRKRIETVTPNIKTESASPKLQPLALLVLVALGLLLFKLLYVDRASNLWVAHSDGTSVQNIAQPLVVPFDNALELLGYETDKSNARHGDTVNVTLYWRTLPGLDKNLSTFVHLTAPDGFVLAQQDSLHPAHVPTTLWDSDVYGADMHTLTLPAALAPGEYELRGGVYDPTTNARSRTPDGADYVVLGKISVR